MRRYIRKKSVFWTLMILGVFVQGMFLIVFFQESVPLGQVLVSELIGVFIGILVGLKEITIFRNNQMPKYKPSKWPYSIIIFFMLLNIVFSGDLEHLKIYIMGFGLYLITLAVIFKVYENKTNQMNITWTELLDE
jgi:hypothetical protein